MEERPMSFPRTAKRVLATAGITMSVIVALALPAAAHVTIDPGSASPGGYAAFSVQVPNEETDADTVKVQVYLPVDHPIASVSVQPTPGWAVEVTKGPLPKPIKTDDGEVTQAVTRITWSGGRIQPGRFQRFGVSMGPLPTDTATLYLKALQTYADKTGRTHVVRWIDLPSGGAEPEHPAPSITLAKATTAQPAARPAQAVTRGGSGAGTMLGAAGLVVALIALGTAVFGLRRSREGTGT